MATALDNAEFEFTREYLEETYEKYQEWTQVESADDVRLIRGKGYSSWFELGSDDKNYPLAKFTQMGIILFKTSMLDR